MLRHRSLRRLGGWLAVAGLWFQLVLSFAHIHPEDVFGPLGHPVIQGYGISVVSRGERASPSAPLAPEPRGAHDDCAICATVAIAGSLVLPEAVTLPLPSGGPVGAAPEPSRVALLAAPFLLFQTRAPPSV